MNDIIPPGQLPTQITQTTPSSYVPHLLGDDPADREPISGFVTTVECMLRQPKRLMFQLRQPGAGKLIARMLFVTVACSLIYGVVVGSFSGGMQWWAAPVKIAVGLLISALICLPTLYIFACLSGSQARPAEILGFVTGLLMLMSILLIGFAPVAWLFSQSTASVAWMGALHLLFWFVSTMFGLRFLEKGFSYSKARSGSGLWMWILVFVLVVLQMTTALRPMVGASKSFFPAEKVFFLEYWANPTR
jgi:hypothetical protein